MALDFGTQCICFPLAFVAPFAAGAQVGSAASPEPPATIVLFTPGGYFHGWGDQLKKPVGKAVNRSEGSVFDGSDLVAVLTPSRYLVLKVRPGPHTFSANEDWHHQNTKESLPLELKPGSTTFLVVTSTMNQYGGLWLTKASHISVATCQAFVDAHASDKSKLVPEEKVGDNYLSLRDTSDQALQCTP